MSGLTRYLSATVLAASLLLGAHPALADYKDDIGLTQLQAELGLNVPTGAGVSVLQVEASVSETQTEYAPNQADPQFSGKTFTLTSGPLTSWHATDVGHYLYGNTSGIAPGITNITAQYANDFLNSSLNTGSASTAPANLSAYKVQNHSWVGNSVSSANILRRLDYMIHQDNVVSVVGVNNPDNGGPMSLLSNSYNSISVGLTNGTHVYGTTGLQRPDIVAPSDFTSFATPMVSGAAALLVETGTTILPLASRANAIESVTVKAVLMAGATKSEFGGNWNRTDTRPIDDQYGAGELNVYNSYTILTAGEQNGSAAPSSTVASTGWDFNTINNGGESLYFFDLTASGDISVSLNWNIIYTPQDGTNYSNMSATLANLNLYLYSVDGSVFIIDAEDLIQQSISSDQNLEYLWVTGLEAGRYAIRVTNETTGANTTEYAVAWQVVPEPSTILLSLAGLVILCWVSRPGRRTAR